MKKYFLLFFLVTTLGYSVGENISTLETISKNTIQSGSTNIITKNFDMTPPEGLKNIKAQFCNETKTAKAVSLEMRPGQRKNICVMLFNTSNEPINLTFGFSSGQKNKDGVPVCDGDIGITNIFSKHILNNITSGMVVPASGYIVKNFSFLSPKDASGSIMGCFQYQLEGEGQAQPGGMFILTTRNVGYIHIKFKGKPYKYGWWDDIKDSLYKDTILKTIIAIIIILIIITIFQKDTKDKKNKKKKT